MAPSRASGSTPNLNTVYSLSLLTEYTHTLDTLPLDVSRNFADLRELDAVLSSSMASITSKINTLTHMIEQGTSSKEERLWLLTEIAEEATRVKLGGDDKIRVASQATDNIKNNISHIRTLAENIPDFDPSTLNRKTSYPHVSTRSYMPALAFDTGRRRRGGHGSLLVSSSHDLSPSKKRQRVPKDDNGYEIIRSPRKERTQDSNSRPRARARKSDRPASPSESVLSVTSNTLVQPNATNTSSRGGANNSTNSRNNGSSNTQSLNKRSRASANQHANNRSATPHIADHVQEQNGVIPHHHHHQQAGVNGAGAGTGSSNGGGGPSSSNPRGGGSRDAYSGLPPTAAPHHSSLAMSYQNGNGHINRPGAYDMHVIPHQSMATAVQDWTPPMVQQLEGPGMPVSRGHTVMPIVPVNTVVGPGIGGTATPVMETTDAGDDGDGDDNRRYCICNGVSYGEMIACDDRQCDREWFHLSCINLSMAPQGQWFCESCRNKRSYKRANRGGKRRAPAAQRAVTRGRVF